MVTPNPLLHAADSSCKLIGSDRLQASVTMSQCTNKSVCICQAWGNSLPLCLHTYELRLGQIPINHASHHCSSMVSTMPGCMSENRHELRHARPSFWAVWDPLFCWMLNSAMRASASSTLLTRSESCSTFPATMLWCCLASHWQGSDTAPNISW